MIEFSLFVPRVDTVMRTEMEEELAKTLRDIALKLRGEYDLTQAKFGEALVMSERSYQEIEAGRNACSALTAVLIVLKLDQHPEYKALLISRLEKAYALEPVLI